MVATGPLSDRPGPLSLRKPPSGALRPRGGNGPEWGTAKMSAGHTACRRKPLCTWTMSTPRDSGGRHADPLRLPSQEFRLSSSFRGARSSYGTWATSWRPSQSLTSPRPTSPSPSDAVETRTNGGDEVAPWATSRYRGLQTIRRPTTHSHAGLCWAIASLGARSSRRI
jgi:hypothetical protein